MSGTIPYKINPVKATCAKYKGTLHGIQGMNDTCFGICAAFSGTADVFSMDPQCTQACENMIEQQRIQLYGVGKCDHQTPHRPVVWEQVPRYVPQLLREGLAPAPARNQCMAMCAQYVPGMVSDCQEKCQLDFDAIELQESFDIATDVTRKLQALERKEQQALRKEEDEADKNRHHSNLVLMVSISIAIVIVATVIVANIAMRSRR